MKYFEIEGLVKIEELYVNPFQCTDNWVSFLFSYANAYQFTRWRTKKSKRSQKAMITR